MVEIFFARFFFICVQLVGKVKDRVPFFWKNCSREVRNFESALTKRAATVIIMPSKADIYA